MNIELILRHWFVDYFNPTEKELRVWMEDPDAFEAMQDWDLVVGGSQNLLALVRLASNDGPQREYIVHYLHVATAESFNWSRATLKKATELVPEDTFEDVLNWRIKAEYLLNNPNTYREEEWLDWIHSQDE